ncbi:MAG TPA: tetratricopeptide repeat protein [Phycisphaerales bacterium]|nr:tetratricopeptide repeat protein [Phycisphaerales bacterium]
MAKASKPEDTKGKTAPKGEPPPEEVAPPVIETVGPLRGGRDRWQIPTVLLGVIALVAGLLLIPKRSAGPDYEGALKSAEAMVEMGEYDRAIEFLNGPVSKVVNDPATTSVQRGKFYALRGDALYLAQRARGLNLDANHKSIQEQYSTASRIDPSSIRGRRLGFLADTQVSLGHPDEAERTLKDLGAEEPELRRRVFKRLIEKRLASSTPDLTALAGQLDGFRNESGLSNEDQLWAVARRNEIRLLSRSPQKLIDEVLVELQRQPDQSRPEVGELFLLLGRAYIELGRLEQARTHLTRAEQVIPDSRPEHGLAEVLLGRLAQSQGDLENARDRFAGVVARYQSTDAMLPAHLGLAEVEFDLGHENESFASYREVVDRLPHRGPRTEVTTGDAERSLAQRYRKSFEEGQYESALRLAELAAGLYAGQEEPEEAPLRLAETHLALAERMQAALPTAEDGSVASGDPVTLRDIRSHFAQASEHYRRYGQRIGIKDPTAAADALWKAADAADRAGDQQAAINLFTGYAGDRVGDPRRLEAKRRLAQLFQARGEHKTTIALLEELIANGPETREAYDSRVPLARSYLARNAEGDAEKAETILSELVNGRKLDPTAKVFREALVELGVLYRRTGRYPQAIARLTESLERFPDAPEATHLRFELADSLRLSAAEIEQQLTGAMPVSERASLTTLREERLRSALETYSKVYTEIEARRPDQRSTLESLWLRNSVLYRADCAFDLGDYDGAIRLYDSAAQRFANDPASLVAMVQIVNCYAALGKWGEARTAHERARARLAELPEEVWKSGDAPMDRRHWERWLEASSHLGGAGPASNGPTSTAEGGDGREREPG